MSHTSKDVRQKEAIQAIVIADNFTDDFLPITNDMPLCLLPVLNTPLIDYTLEFLSLGGIEEVFLFCCTNVEVIKDHIQACIKEATGWSLTMKVNVVVSESCRSFGDCLRDLDAKGLIRGDFVLLDSGVVGNIKLLPILKKHSETCKIDKGAAMTIILQETGIGQIGRCENEDLLLISTSNNCLLFHEKLGKTKHNKIDLPLEILTDNSNVHINYNLKDTHIAICSASVLPLFSDNFDFQTRDDFVRGLLMNDEILGSKVYWHLIKGSQYAAAINSWRMYQAVSHDILHRWLYPLVPDMGIATQQRNYIHLKNNVYRNKNVFLTKYSNLGEDVLIGSETCISDNSQITKSIIGDNVKIGKNVIIKNSFIFSNTRIGDNCTVTHSVIGPQCVLKQNCIVTAGSILGKDVQLPIKTFLEDCLVQNQKPVNDHIIDKLSEKAYRLRQVSTCDTSDSEEDKIVKQLSRLRITDAYEESDDESVTSSDSDEQLSYTTSPVLDDTNLFLTEVVDSLARGFEDKLHCDNLILEINSSRYAYNVTVKEVNFNVTKAILTLPFQLFVGQSYLPSLRHLLVYFLPILKNYIRNDTAMIDCLQACEDVANANNELKECVSAVVNWFYDKDLLSEGAILNWVNKIDQSTRLYKRVEPFINWLKEAEEASSSDEE